MTAPTPTCDHPLGPGSQDVLTLARAITSRELAPDELHVEFLLSASGGERHRLKLSAKPYTVRFVRGSGGAGGGAAGRHRAHLPRRVGS